VCDRKFRSAEILAVYAEVTGLDLSGIGWYQAFGAWKTAVVMQQLYDRYLRGETSDERMASRLEPAVDVDGGWNDASRDAA
jgi:aminoglycoside phosphotransferase (APT) family kinase protein